MREGRRKKAKREEQGGGARDGRKGKGEREEGGRRRRGGKVKRRMKGRRGVKNVMTISASKVCICLNTSFQEWKESFPCWGSKYFWCLHNSCHTSSA